MNDESKEYRRENIREDIKESKDGNDRKLGKIKEWNVDVQDGGTIMKPPVVNKRLELPPPLILQQHILILNIASIIFRIFSMLNLMFLFST